MNTEASAEQVSDRQVTAEWEPPSVVAVVVPSGHNFWEVISPEAQADKVESG
jgi:hypothetical protein